MKNCPTCRTQYTDDTLRFCLQDGSTLVEQLSADTPTVAFPETPTVAAHRPETRSDRWQTEEPTRVKSVSKDKKRSGAVVPVVATAAVMVVLFVVIGIGLWAYLKSRRANQPTDITANKSNINGLLPSNQVPYFPTPTATATPPRQPSATATPPPFPTPPPPADMDQTRREVSQSINGWKSMAEARNLNSYMDNYADTVDYYRRSGASRAFVRADKARAFTMYDSIRVEISNMRVSADESGTTATAVFDKEWDFRGRRTSSGKVQQQLKLRNENGRWLITGERDLRVYYTR